MPRLFTALEIPFQLSQRLSLIRGNLNGARWLDTENYHITLRFIGDVDNRTADEIAFALDRVRRQSFSLETRSLDAFGGNKPRSLFARVSKSPELVELQKDHERIVQRAGLAPEGRRFEPHITLARLHQTKATEVARFLSLNGNLGTQNFAASRFVLMSSKESSGGGPYIVEEAYELGTRSA